MQIDWFTFIAQLVNFAILLVLLKRFVYRPVLEMIERREQRMAEKLARADEMSASAEEHERSVRQMEAALTARRDEELEAVRREAETYRTELMDKTRTDVQKRQDSWEEAIERERTAFLEDLRLEAGQRVLGVARRVLSDLADEDLEQRIRQVFLRRLKDIPDDDKARLRQAVRDQPDGSYRLELKSPVDNAFVEDLEQILSGITDCRAAVHVDVDPSRGPGIAVRMPGWKLAWNVSDYVDSLEVAFREIASSETASSEAASSEIASSETGAREPESPEGKFPEEGSIDA